MCVRVEFSVRTRKKAPLGYFWSIFVAAHNSTTTPKEDKNGVVFHRAKGELLG